MTSISTISVFSGTGPSDIAVNNLHGFATAKVVRKVVYGVASPHATQRVAGALPPVTLPSGERGVFEGQGPSFFNTRNSLEHGANYPTGYPANIWPGELANV